MAEMFMGMPADMHQRRGVMKWGHIRCAQASEEQQFMRQVPSGEWVRDQHVVRVTSREAPWALEEGGAHHHTRLPVLNALRCGRVSLELAGLTAAACWPCQPYCFVHHETSC